MQVATPAMLWDTIGSHTASNWISITAQGWAWAGHILQIIVWVGPCCILSTTAWKRRKPRQQSLACNRPYTWTIPQPAAITATNSKSSSSVASARDCSCHSSVVSDCLFCWRVCSFCISVWAAALAGLGNPTSPSCLRLLTAFLELRSPVCQHGA